MSKKLICFDLDGTLIDSRADIASSVSHALEHFGAKGVASDDITPMVGHGLLKTVELAAKLSGLEIDLEKAKKITVDYYNSNPVVNTYMYECVPEGLKELHDRGFVIALFSNKLTELCEKILGILGIKNYFTYIVGAGSGFKMKPEPEALNFMLNDASCNPLDSYMVGDSDVDMETGKRAGIKLCFASYGYGKRELYEPDATIDSFAQLPSLLM